MANLKRFCENVTFLKLINTSEGGGWAWVNLPLERAPRSAWSPFTHPTGGVFSTTFFYFSSLPFRLNV